MVPEAEEMRKWKRTFFLFHGKTSKIPRYLKKLKKLARRHI